MYSTRVVRFLSQNDASTMVRRYHPATSVYPLAVSAAPQPDMVPSTRLPAVTGEDGDEATILMRGIRKGV
jgi:hypothetical protein